MQLGVHYELVVASSFDTQFGLVARAPCVIFVSSKILSSLRLLRRSSSSRTVVASCCRHCLSSLQWREYEKRIGIHH